MLNRIGIGAGLLGIAITTAAVADKNYDVSVDRTYSASDGSTVQGVGVCSFTAENVSCWNMDGAPAPDLGDRIRSYYVATYGNELSFAFGKKNRLLVLERSNSQTGANLSNPDGGYAPTGQINQNGNGPYLFWAREGFDKGAKQGSIIASIYGLPGPKPVVVPFAEGSKATFEDVAVVLGGYKEITNEPGNMNNGFPGGFGGGGIIDGMRPAGASKTAAQKPKAWLIFLSVENSANAMGQLSYVALGKDGKQINYVDRQGNPVSDVTFLKETAGKNPSPYMPAPQNGKYLTANLQSYGPSAGTAWSLQSNINPAKIGSLKVSMGHQVRVLITGFPLEPK
jgi:hypothetical protein